jgi:type IV pilus assembly protein PilM
MAETIVALDLGATHIRGIEAQVKKGALPKILKVHSVPIEQGVIASGLISDEETLSAALKKLWSEGKFSAKKVIGMATGDAYDNRVLDDVPWSPPADFKKLLPYYLRDRLPYDTEEYYFDSHTLNEYYKTNSADNQRYKHILVTGVARKFTDAFIRSAEGAGLIPIGLDILPLALIRANAVTSEAPQNAVIVSIDLGGDITTIVVHQNNQPQYINTATPLGGIRITEEISRALGIPMSDADMIKISFSYSDEEKTDLVASTYYEDGTTRQTRFSDIPQTVLDDAYSIIAREVSNLIAHIGDILEDAFAERGENPFEIVLSGRASELVTLASRIQSELGVPVRILRPFGGNTKKLPEDVVNHQNGYAGIYGLLVGQSDE